jgi:uncharacterized RDD family membrane protein YckC
LTKREGMFAAERWEPPPVERAGAVTRFAAFFVDAIIIAVTLRSASWLLRATARVLGHFAPPVNLNAVLVALVPLLVAVYNLAFWTMLGQTPGKWLMGVKIVPVEGGRLPFRRALLRLFGYLLSALPVYLGYLWILGPRRRGWHDILANTEVTYVRRRHAVTALTAAQVRERMQAPVIGPVSYRPPPRPSKAGARP